MKNYFLRLIFIKKITTKLALIYSIGLRTKVTAIHKFVFTESE